MEANMDVIFNGRNYLNLEEKSRVMYSRMKSLKTFKEEEDGEILKIVEKVSGLVERARKLIVKSIEEGAERMKIMFEIEQLTMLVDFASTSVADVNSHTLMPGINNVISYYQERVGALDQQLSLLKDQQRNEEDFAAAENIELEAYNCEKRLNEIEELLKEREPKATQE